MNVVYNVEDQFIEKKANSKDIIDWINKDKNDVIERPSNLTLIHAKHCEGTGMTGVAFKDNKTGEILIGYAGRNYIERY